MPPSYLRRAAHGNTARFPFDAAVLFFKIQTRSIGPEAGISGTIRSIPAFDPTLPSPECFAWNLAGIAWIVCVLSALLHIKADRTEGRRAQQRNAMRAILQAETSTATRCTATRCSKGRQHVATVSRRRRSKQQGRGRAHSGRNGRELSGERLQAGDILRPIPLRGGIVREIGVDRSILVAPRFDRADCRGGGRGLYPNRPRMRSNRALQNGPPALPLIVN